MNVTLPLLSIGKVCDTNCTAVFRKDDMLIANDNDINIQLLDKPLVTGPRDRNRTGLWKIPIPKSECASAPIWTKEMALSAYNQKTEEDLAIYLHGCAGYPVIETWIESIRAGRYATWPKLNKFKGPKWIRKHLPKQTVTTMGHMKAVRQGTRSTTNNNKNEQQKDDNNNDKKDDDIGNFELESPHLHLELAKGH